jgi:hypothetical protein
MAAVLVGGCEAPAPSGDEVLATAEELARPRPGRYRTTTTLTAYELPRAAPQVLDRMRERMRRVRPEQRETCLREEEARAGFKPLLLAMSEEDCRFERFEAEGTRMSGTMSCTTPAGVQSRIELAGTAEAERSSLRLDVDQRGAGIPGGVAQMGLQIDNQRVGDC